MLRQVLYAARLIAAISTGLTLSADAQSRFYPAFPNDFHQPRAEDVQIVQLIGNLPRNPQVVGLVHGHFLGDGKDAVVVTAAWEVQGGFEPIALVFSREASGWRLHLRDNSEITSYCRVLPLSARKDVLLCHSGFEPNGKVYTNLYTIDFTRDVPVSYFLQLEDTVASGSRCLSWANVKSLGVHDGIVNVLVDYGRTQLPADETLQAEFRNRVLKSDRVPSGFPVRSFALDFTVSEGELRPTQHSKTDYDYVTAKWARNEAACSAARRP